MKANPKYIFALTFLLALGLFSCKKDKGPETVTDVDGNVYKTVKIGDQIWMAENLKTTKLNNGIPITYVPNFSIWTNANNNFPMMTYYAYDYSNFVKYGALYNFQAIETGKLAPEGWHVATNDDWEKLKTYLISSGFNYDGSTAENKIAKSLASTSGWESSATPGHVGNNEPNNKSNFNAAPGGWFFIDNVGGFLGLGAQATFWSSTSITSTEGTFWNLYSNDMALYNFPISKRNGVYVRCVKD